MTYSEMHQQQQLQRIVGSFGFVALPANPLAPTEAKARPMPRPVSPVAATEVVESPVEVPDIEGCTVLPSSGATSSTDPVGGGGGLFGTMFRLPGWCKRQKTAPAADPAPEEPPPEAPADEEPKEEAPESQKPDAE